MKKLLLFLFSTFIFITIQAQSNNVVTAYMHLQSGELDQAKSKIDQAAKHDVTKTRAKTWKYRGDIYYKLLNNVKPEYAALESNPAKVSFQSYKKAKSLDAKEYYTKEINRNLKIIQNIALNQGVNHYNKKNYNLAYDQFLTSVDIARHFGQTDSLAVYNCALSSERAGKIDQAINWYKQCININYRAANCCSFIVYLLESQNKEAEALAQISECRQQFPNDQNILVKELNYFLKTGKLNEAQASLKTAIKNDPQNYILYFTQGSVLNSIGKNNDAITAYKAAINLKPDYFDANYNLGALFFNLGVDVNNKASNETNKEKYTFLQERADKHFNEALVYLEKARSIKPKDRNTLNSLKTLYIRLGNTEKYNEITNLLKN